MTLLNDLLSSIFGQMRTLSSTDQQIQALTDLVGEQHQQIKALRYDLTGVIAHLTTVEEHHDTLAEEFGQHRHERYAQPEYPVKYTTGLPVTNETTPEVPE